MASVSQRGMTLYDTKLIVATSNAHLVASSLIAGGIVLWLVELRRTQPLHRPSEAQHAQVVVTPRCRKAVASGRMAA